MSQVTLARTIDMDQAWMAKQEAIIFFGYRDHKALFQKLLKEFKTNCDFSDGYMLPTSNLPIINISKFEEFLKWRDKNKYKRNK